MSFPRDLDEMSERELTAELRRRWADRARGLCDYCHRAVATPPCRFRARHRGDVTGDYPGEVTVTLASGCG